MNKPVYVLMKHAVTEKFENEVYVYGVYSDYEKCYEKFKTIIENYGKDYDMWDNSFTEGDMAVELHLGDNTTDYENYTSIWIEERTLID